MSDETMTQTPAPATAPAAPSNVEEHPAPEVVDTAPRVETRPPAVEPPGEEATVIPLSDLRDLMAEVRALRQQTEALQNTTTEQAAKLHEKREAERVAALDGAGLDPQYRDAVPRSIDPTTSEGREKLDAWLAERPAMLKRDPPPQKTTQDLIGDTAPERSWLRLPGEQIADWVAKSNEYRKHGKRVH